MGLGLNRTTGKYELVFKLEVDADCFTQALFSYAKKNNIDPTNLLEWEQAIHHVASFEQWKEHPHARIVLGGEEQPKTRQEIPAPEPAQETRWASPTEEEKKALRDRALDLPVSEWDSLKTPIPQDIHYSQKKWCYQRRSYEQKVLDALKAERAPNPLEQIQAVAELMGANSIH